MRNAGCLPIALVVLAILGYQACVYEIWPSYVQERERRARDKTPELGK